MTAEVTVTNTGKVAGKEVVEDAKGMRTRDYILKRKMMLYFHGIKIQEW